MDYPNNKADSDENTGIRRIDIARCEADVRCRDHRSITLHYLERKNNHP